MDCKRCKSSILVKAGKSKSGLQRFKCKSCLKYFFAERSDKEVDISKIKIAYSYYSNKDHLSIKEIAKKKEVGITHSVIYKWMTRNKSTDFNDIENPFERIGRIKSAFPKLQKELQKHNRHIIVRYFKSHISVYYRLEKVKETRDLKYRMFSFNNIRIKENGNILFQLKVHFFRQEKGDRRLVEYSSGQFNNRCFSDSKVLSIKNMTESEFLENFVDHRIDPNYEDSPLPIDVISDITITALEAHKRKRKSSRNTILQLIHKKSLK